MHLAVMRQLAACLVILGLAIPVFGADKAKDRVLVDFAGAVKRITKKEIVIETTPDNQMTFVRTKRTAFMSGGRQMDGASLPSGITVSVQAFEKLNRELEAVSVTVALPDQSPNK